MMIVMIVLFVFVVLIVMLVLIVLIEGHQQPRGTCQLTSRGVLLKVGFSDHKRGCLDQSKKSQKADMHRLYDPNQLDLFGLLRMG